MIRDYRSVEKAAAGGVGAYKLKKPPIADQMHVILWLIKANDLRFELGRYRDLMNFAQRQLSDRSKLSFPLDTFVGRTTASGRSRGGDWGARRPLILRQK